MVNTSTHIWALVASAALFGGLVLSGCGDDGEEESASNGATSNSTTGGTASNGETSNGTTSNNTTGGTTGGTTGNTTVIETDFPIVYTAKNRSEVPGIDPGGALMIMLSDGSAEVKVNPDEIECHFGCDISDDRMWFIWSSPDGTRTLNIAPITDISFDGADVDLGNTTTLGSDVASWQVEGSNIAWVTSEFEAFAGPLPGTGAVSLGQVGDGTGTTGGVYLKPDGSEAIVWRLPDLITMDLSRYILGGETSEDFYGFRSTGFGGTGSFYGAREKMALSPDGRYLAVATRGLKDTTPCTENSQCLTTETCGATGRCTSQRLVINMIDFESVDKLDASCASDAECGTAHFCDFADPADAESGRCQAGRLDLGAAGPMECTFRQDGEFTELRDSLSWSPDSEYLYFLAIEDCSRYNIPRAAIKRTTPTLDTPEVVVENTGQDFNASSCFDPDEQEFVVDSPDCVVDISEFALAPTGNTVVFTGSSPKAANNFEVYTIDSQGNRGKRLLTDALQTVAESIHLLEDL